MLPALPACPHPPPRTEPISEPTHEQPSELPALDFLSTNLDLASRTILVGDIEEGAADLVIKQLHLLVQAGESEIRVLINSRGGDLVDGLAIYDAIRTCGCHVVTEAIGHCMSAGVIVAIAGDVRLTHANAVTLLHNPSHVFEGDSLSLSVWGKYASLTRKRIYALLTERCGRTESYWRRACSRGDKIYTAQQAVDAGLFDSIIEHD